MRRYVHPRFNLSNNLSLSHQKGGLAKFLVFNSSKWRILHRTKAPLASAIIAESQDIRKEIIINVSSLGAFGPLTEFSNILPVLNDGLQGTTGVLPKPPA